MTLASISLPWLVDHWRRTKLRELGTELILNQAKVGEAHVDRVVQSIDAKLDAVATRVAAVGTAMGELAQHDKSTQATLPPPPPPPPPPPAPTIQEGELTASMRVESAALELKAAVEEAKVRC